jgi:hypothetical protein
MAFCISSNEWLAQRRPIADRLGNYVRCIPGRENDRPLSQFDDFGNRRNQLTANIDIEDSKIEFSGPRQRYGLRYPAGLAEKCDGLAPPAL